MPKAASAPKAISPKVQSADGGRVLSIQYSVCLYVCVCMFILSSAKTEPNELKFGTVAMGVGILQPLQALASMQIVGVESENVRGGHENSCKFTSEVKY